MAAPRPLTFLKALIAEAELRFGGRIEPSARILVGLIDQGPPFAWMTSGPTSIVFVGQDLLDDVDTLTYQLAHEALHCLGTCRATSALEEGLGTLFGLDNSMLPKVRSETERHCLDPERAGYLKDVEELLAIDPDIVRNLRRPPRPFEAIEAADLTACGVPADLVGRLCRSTGT